MNFLVENWILLAVAFVSGGMLVWPMVRGGAGGGTTVPLNEAVRLINRERAVLVDVGEPAEYAAGHAAGARSVPFGQIGTSKDLPTNKTLPLVVLCPTGARAGRAAALLRKAGHSQAVALAGGTAAWREAGFAMEKAGEKTEKADKPTAKPADKPADKGTEKAA